MIDILLPTLDLTKGSTTTTPGWRPSLENEKEPAPLEPKEAHASGSSSSTATQAPMTTTTSTTTALTSRYCSDIQPKEEELASEDLVGDEAGSTTIRLVDYDDDEGFCNTHSTVSPPSDFSPPEPETKEAHSDNTPSPDDPDDDERDQKSESSSSPSTPSILAATIVEEKGKEKVDFEATESSDLDEDDEDLAEEEKRVESKWARQRQDLRWRWAWIQLQINEVQRLLEEFESREKKGLGSPKLASSAGEQSNPSNDEKEAISKIVDRGLKPSHETLVSHPLFSFSVVTGSLPKRKAVPKPDQPAPPRLYPPPRPPIAHKSIGGGLVERTKKGMAKKALTHVNRSPIRSVLPKKKKNSEKRTTNRPSISTPPAALPATPPISAVNSPVVQRGSAKKSKEVIRSKRDIRMSSERTPQKVENELRSSWGPQKKKGLRTADFDINNIVIPFSMASATTITVVKAKEVHTPTWRLAADIPDPTDEGDSDEDTSDEAYSARHREESRKEKIRYAQLEKKLTGRTSQATKELLPDNFFVTTEAGDNSPPGSPRRNKRPLKNLSHSVDVIGGEGGEGGKGNSFLRSSLPSSSASKKKRKRFVFSSTKKKKAKRSLTQSTPEMGSSRSGLAESRGFCSDDEDELNSLLLDHQLDPRYCGRWEVVPKPDSAGSSPPLEDTAVESHPSEAEALTQERFVIKLRHIPPPVEEAKTGPQLETETMEATATKTTTSTTTVTDKHPSLPQQLPVGEDYASSSCLPTSEVEVEVETTTSS